MASVLSRGTRRAENLIRHNTYRLESLVGHHSFARFLILTRSRSGSNLLVSFLNSHPNIYVEGEIFAEIACSKYKKRLGHVFGRQPRRIKAKGFKIFYYHPNNGPCTPLWTDLERMPHLRVIHLVRRNMLRTEVSRKIAESQGTWTGTSFDKEASQRSKTISLNAEALRESFEKTSAWIKDADSRFHEHQVLNISYEELSEDPIGTFQRVTDYLAVGFVPPKTNLHKQNPESLSHLITNYWELKEQFKGSEWEKYFTD